MVLVFNYPFKFPEKRYIFLSEKIFTDSILLFISAYFNKLKLEYSRLTIRLNSKNIFEIFVSKQMAFHIN